MTDRFDTEETFAAAIKRCGGVAVAETLTTRSFDNADFYFPEGNTVIELKCLTENGFTKQTYREWMEDRYIDWVKRGLAPRRKPPFAFDLQQLPRECYEEVLRKIVTKLERNFVRKANRQIRETRHHFGMPHAHGVLAIANDGDLSLPPLYVHNALNRLLSGANFPCITEVFHFSANTSLQANGDGEKTHFWVNWLVPGRSRVPKELTLSIREAWKLEHNLKLDEEVRTVDASSTQAIDGMRFTQTATSGPNR